MRYEATLTVPRAIADEMDRLCRKTPTENLGKVRLFDEEVHFSNGMMMAIQVIPCDEEPAWTQGVLYEPAADPTKGFCEVSCSDVEDSLTGDYEVFVGEDDEYLVTVVAGDVEDVTFEVKT